MVSGGASAVEGGLDGVVVTEVRYANLTMLSPSIR